MLSMKLPFFNHKRVEYKSLSQVTEQMKEFSFTRTSAHKQRVKDNMVLMEGYKGLSLDELENRATKHDDDKCSDELCGPYIWLNWKSHQAKTLSTNYQYPDESISAAVNSACWAHVRQNKHHPEAHMSQYLIDSLSKIDKMNTHDQEVLLQQMSTELEKMTILDIVEMVCDWKAMSQEYGTDCGKFLDDNIGPNKRWNFSSAKRQLIYDIHQELDNRLSNPTPTLCM